jgi:hypothetical protein
MSSQTQNKTQNESKNETQEKTVETRDWKCPECKKINTTWTDQERWFCPTKDCVGEFNHGFSWWDGDAKVWRCKGIGLFDDSD